MMKLKIKITPQTPLLVSSGKTLDVTRPAMEFFRVNTPNGETIYIPGSSIKGVLRAGLEAILGENKNSKIKICCTSEKMCHEEREKRDSRNKVPYQSHCPVCRIFGSGDLASRLEISDIFPYHLDDPEDEKKKKIEQAKTMISSRTGIQIDRKTGKTKGGALFDYEILGGGELFGEFTLTNYELYQPGLLFMLFSLSNEGFLRYGHSKSRGLGVLNFTIESIKIMQMGSILKGGKIKGVGILHELDEQYKKYGFYMKDNDLIEKDFTHDDNLLYSTFSFTEPTAIAELGEQFKTKIDKFLKEG
jgi:CRISPR-associated RAMP protein (TIGR02581 family)